MKKIVDEKINIILDTDTYNTYDDQFALAYLLLSQEIFNIEAITIAPYSRIDKNITTKDSQELSYKEALRICNYLKFDPTNKVFKESIDYMQNDYQENNEAVNKIIEIAKKKRKTYLLAIGALTNVALAIKKGPEIINKIEVIWLGGNDLSQNNNKEFNFIQDIEAVKIVFSSKVPLTIIPCKNVTSNLILSIEELNHYLKDKNSLCNYLINTFYYHGFTE